MPAGKRNLSAKTLLDLLNDSGSELSDSEYFRDYDSNYSVSDSDEESDSSDRPRPRSAGNQSASDHVVSDSESSGRPTSLVSEDEEIEVQKPPKKKQKTNTWHWTEEANDPNVFDFIENTGISSSVTDSFRLGGTELDFMYAFLTDDFWSEVVQQTNNYAAQQLGNPQRKSLKDDNRWLNVTIDEMKAYFCLTILMSQVKKSSIQNYWSNRKCIETPFFSSTMPYARFRSISRFLHFSNNATADPSDKLKKIRPIITLMDEKFLSAYTPGKNIAIDESLMKFRGRLGYVQFNPSKRARFGIKFYKLCESETGYCSAFKIYTGHEEGRNNEMLASEEIVLNLAAPLLNKGYIIHLDNWYSSPELYQQLIKENTHALGTVKPTRRNMPEVFKSTKLKEKGSAIARTCNEILAVKWKDRKEVHVLSTLHSDIDMVTVVRQRRNTEVEKPKCIVDYNKGMLAVDRQDQVLASFPLMRRYIKGYRKIFFYLLDMCLYNAFVLYKIHSKNKKMHYSRFRINIAEQLMSTLNLPERTTTGRPSIADNPLRLQAKNWAHLPENIPPTPCKQLPTKPCKVCKQHKKRSETRWQCSKCLVPLHLPECFKSYHTLLHY